MFSLPIGFARHGFNGRFDFEPKLIIKESGNPRFGLDVAAAGIRTTDYLPDSRHSTSQENIVFRMMIAWR